MKSALLLVNLQVDYAPGGSVPVPGGDEIVSKLNKLMKRVDLVVAIREWHPHNHVSFAVSHKHKMPGDLYQEGEQTLVLRPLHCSQDSTGAEFLSSLNVDDIGRIINTGVMKNLDDRSGFFEQDHQQPTELGEYLSHQNVEVLYVAGMPLESNVRHTAIDGAKMGFIVHVIGDLCRGREMPPGNADNALKELEEAGVKIITSGELFNDPPAQQTEDAKHE